MHRISDSKMKKESKKENKSWQTKEGESVFLYDIKEDRLIGTLPAAFMIDAEGNYSEACNYSISDVKSLIDGNGKICYNLPKGKYKLSVKELNQEKAQIVVMNSDNSTRYTIVDEGNFSDKKFWLKMS